MLTELNPMPISAVQSCGKPDSGQSVDHPDSLEIPSRFGPIQVGQSWANAEWQENGYAASRVIAVMNLVMSGRL